MTTSPDGPPPLRIGTKERESAFTALSAHLDAGRLDPEEYGERYGLASVARTRAELDALFVDLPAPHPSFDFAPTGASRPSWDVEPAAPRQTGRPGNVWRLAPVLFALLPFIVIALAISTGFWIFFLIIPAVASMFGRRGWGGRRHRSWAGWGGPRW